MQVDINGGAANGRVGTQPGQLVRYTLTKDDTNMFGLVQAVASTGSETTPHNRNAEEASSGAADAKSPSRDALVTFYFKNPQAAVGEENPRSKQPLSLPSLHAILSLRCCVRLFVGRPNKPSPRRWTDTA